MATTHPGTQLRGCPGPFRTNRSVVASRPSSARPQRSRVVVVASEADRTRDQNTVGDLNKDQIQAALERQLEKSKAKKQQNVQETVGILGALGAEFNAGEEDEVPLSEEAATEQERQESLRALKQLRERVPLMNQHDMDAAMERLLSGGKGSSQ